MVHKRASIPLSRVSCPKARKNAEAIASAFFDRKSDLLQHVQHERQDDERSADPLGGTRKTGIRALGLVLGHE